MLRNLSLSKFSIDKNNRGESHLQLELSLRAFLFKIYPRKSIFLASSHLYYQNLADKKHLKKPFIRVYYVSLQAHYWTDLRQNHFN